MPPSAWAARMRSAPLPSRRMRSISSSAASAEVVCGGRASTAAAIRSRTGRSAPSCQTVASSPSRPGAEGGLDEHLAGERLVGASGSCAARQHEPVDERGQPARPSRAGPGRPSRAPRACRASGAGAGPTRRTCSPRPRRRRRARADRLDVVVPAGERARDVGARVAAEHLRAGGLEAGVDPVPVGRVGGERLQHGQVLAHAVEGADRGLRVGHADVDVQRAGRRAPQQPAHLVADHAGSAR